MLLERIETTIFVIAAVRVARASIVVQALSLLRFDLREVASRNNVDEHEEDEDDHDVEAELAADLNLARDAPIIGAFATKAFSLAFALIKVLLETLLADTHTSSTISKRAARFIPAI